MTFNDFFDRAVCEFFLNSLLEVIYFEEVVSSRDSSVPRSCCDGCGRPARAVRRTHTVVIVYS